jgi:hypothetical protein
MTWQSTAVGLMMQSDDAKLSLLSTVELAIEAPADKAPQAKVTLRTSDIDALTAKLAHLRATMTPEIPRLLADAADVSKVADPLWMLHTPAGAKEKLLIVRHPGLGWMVFQLPQAEAERLGHALLSGDPPRVPDERPATSRLH